MNLILLGAPGAGKGTQAALLAERYDVLRISTGDLLRDAVRRGTPLGREAKTYMDAGELVPDDIMLGLVREVLAEESARDGFVFDGFPRTEAQARGLDRLLDELGRPLDAVVLVEVPEDVLVQRLSGRRSCPRCEAIYNVYTDPPASEGVCDRCGATLVQRVDDAADTVRNRLAVYKRQTEPLVDYYEKSPVPLLRLDGDRAVDDVLGDLLATLER